MRLEGKIAAITGGGGGIGREAALLFAKEGATLLILENDQKSGEAVVEEIKEKGGEAQLYHLDISDEVAVAKTFKEIEEQYKKIDVLYNNASVFWGKKDGPIDQLDMTVFERIVKINLFGLAYCSKYAIPLMKRGGGSIINTSSSAGVIGIPKCDAYTASKGATVSLTRSMAVEYGPYNIRVNCIAPAAIRTPMVAESNLNDPEFDEEHFLTAGTPLRRWGLPEEIANIALFLASDESAYLNGAIIVADGGITIS
ncbi:MAG: SDR family NAD(P)-dependent oxidoreductase [Sphaerochaetaceae bacterium]|jgi:NAD(P)-dependent dehydrogenase (short-subunit alcohol dehydrogenase family)|nr:SDR family oxidoreductase [Sphaerochaetaceae bacterium]HHU89061.1 SDR family oxidoreductase [Spirochaetales bacterium]